MAIINDGKLPLFYFFSSGSFLFFSLSRFSHNNSRFPFSFQDDLGAFCAIFSSLFLFSIELMRAICVDRSISRMKNEKNKNKNLLLSLFSILTHTHLPFPPPYFLSFPANTQKQLLKFFLSERFSRRRSLLGNSREKSRGAITDKILQQPARRTRPTTITAAFCARVCVHYIQRNGRFPPFCRSRRRPFHGKERSIEIRTTEKIVM